MASRDTKKPNIVFILSDDQGYWAMGCAGNKYIQTPNMDRLAETGMMFENSYCASPVCSPARASILTGKMPSQHGVQDWIRLGHYGENALDYLAGQVTLPEILKKDGYECAISGKWHLGDVNSVEKRFPDHTYIHLKGADHYYNAPMVRNGELVYESRYVTDCITDDAIAYLDQTSRTDAPFYLSVHYTAPHAPWINEHPEELTELYRDCPFDDIPQGFIHEDAVYRYEKEDARRALVGYYAAVTGMDRGVGKIIDRLEELGLRENTMIVYCADNGFNCGHHGIWGKGNGTFSLNMFDTSVKVPLIVSFPAQVPAGVKSNAMVSQYDYLPTLLEVAGAENPYQDGEVPGKSFLPVLRGEKTEAHDVLVVYDEYGPVRMVRTNEWKYVHRYETGKHELYHLSVDPQEEHNLYGQPGTEEKVEELRANLTDWFAKYTDPVNDGSKQPVRGNGQINMICRLKEGELAFDLNRQARTDPGEADPAVHQK